MIINIKTKYLKNRQKCQKVKVGDETGGGGRYYWLISPGFYSQSLKVAHRACSSAMERVVTRLHTVRLNIK